MRFSNIYILYPDNRALERAIEHSIGLLGDDLTEAATPDTTLTVADNFLYTRGNYEQRRFSANIFESAREVLETSLTEEYRDKEPLAWAEAQNSLGNILAALGQQKADVALFEKAIQCFDHALEVFSQEESPREWAATQCNLGAAQQALGRQLDDAKLLKASIDAMVPQRDARRMGIGHAPARRHFPCVREAS
jgi:tetratricopeptide (TPR) repeat protein